MSRRVGSGNETKGYGISAGETVTLTVVLNDSSANCKLIHKGV